MASVDQNAYPEVTHFLATYLSVDEDGGPEVIMQGYLNAQGAEKTAQLRDEMARLLAADYSDDDLEAYLDDHFAIYDMDKSASDNFQAMHDFLDSLLA